MGKKVYSDEFKRAAVDHVVVQRNSLVSAAQRPGVGSDTLFKWVDHAKFSADKSRIPTNLPAEPGVRKLVKENTRLRMERDIRTKSGGLLREGGPVKLPKACLWSSASFRPRRAAHQRPVPRVARTCRR